MNTLIRFGAIEEITMQGGVEKIVSKGFHEGGQSSYRVNYRESLSVKNHREALAMFLQLVDDYKQGKITDFGLRCFTNKSGEVSRVEKTWTTK